MASLTGDRSVHFFGMQCNYIPFFQVGNLPNVYHFVHIFSPSRSIRSVTEIHPKHYHLKAEVQVSLYSTIVIIKSFVIVYIGRICRAASGEKEVQALPFSHLFCQLEQTVVFGKPFPTGTLVYQSYSVFLSIVPMVTI